MAVRDKVNIDGFWLIRTCGSCPEQYTALDKTGRQAGYLRLRWGEFRVECPDVHGKLVYSAEPEGDGSFEDHERDHYLRQAVACIKEWMEWNPYG